MGDSECWVSGCVPVGGCHSDVAWARGRKGPGGGGPGVVTVPVPVRVCNLKFKLWVEDWFKLAALGRSPCPGRWVAHLPSPS